MTRSSRPCDSTPGKQHFDAPIIISEQMPLPLLPALEKRLQEREPTPSVVALPDKPKLERASEPPTPEPQATDSGLLALILTTMGAALAMLCTPCVFPMIPITVSFFLKQSEKQQRSVLLTALVYSATIIIVLALAVLILGKLIVDLANSPWMNLGLSLVLVFFAFSLFGMYEIELPHFLSQFTSSREGRGGYLGAVFMALTFTITSFTCTGPFLGQLLVATKEMQLDLGRLIVAAFVYSATFAAPFFVLVFFQACSSDRPKAADGLTASRLSWDFWNLPRR
jgi:thiol:disulfide interchange protein DsbD